MSIVRGYIPEMDDRIAVHRDDVRAMAGGNNALVWSYIARECARGGNTRDASENWLRMSVLVLARKTGLNERQVRHAVSWLTMNGLIEARKQRLGLDGPMDQTMSYRPVVGS